LAQNLRRKHPGDLEQLKLDRIAAGIGGGVDKGKASRQLATVVAGGLCNEEGRLSHLTIFKGGMAKKRLTGRTMSHAAAPDILTDGIHHGARIAAANGYDVIACAACGFRHALPLPSPDALEREYRENYYATEKPNFLAHAAEDQPWFALAQTDRLESLERLLPSGRRRLLDIGCGPGFFLANAMQRGWQVRGIEPSRQAAAHARDLGVTVTEGFFGRDTAPKLGRFDAITLTNMLEHVPDPIAILEQARDLLDPGGLICVGVPNDFSPFQAAGMAATGGSAWWVAPPHHLNYFDFESLSALLSRLGFTPVERATSFPMEAFLMMSENYIGDAALGRNCHNKRKKFDFALETAGLRDLRRDFYRALAGLGIGREAVIIAIKA
jgi:SAM-dependent methyltransferase